MSLVTDLDNIEKIMFSVLNKKDIFKFIFVITKTNCTFSDYFGRGIIVLEEKIGMVRHIFSCLTFVTKWHQVG